MVDVGIAQATLPIASPTSQGSVSLLDSTAALHYPTTVQF